jgi:hypothetical protein
LENITLLAELLTYLKTALHRSTPEDRHRTHFENVMVYLKTRIDESYIALNIHNFVSMECVTWGSLVIGVNFM